MRNFLIAGLLLFSWSSTYATDTELITHRFLAFGDSGTGKDPQYRVGAAMADYCDEVVVQRG